MVKNSSRNVFKSHLCPYIGLIRNRKEDGIGRDNIVSRRQRGGGLDSGGEVAVPSQQCHWMQPETNRPWREGSQPCECEPHVNSYNYPDNLGFPSRRRVMDPLGAKILHPQISPQSRCAITNAVWRTNFSPSDFSGNSPADSYFRNYLKHCQPALQGSGNSTFIETHGDVVNIIQLLQETHINRISIKSRIRDNHTEPLDNDLLDNSIDLAARLWLMIPTGGYSHAVVLGQTIIPWTEGNISDILAKNFDGNPTLDTPVKLSKVFNAMNIERIAGIRIIWTDNLADHLRMRDDDTGVCIFHYASFLRYHQS